MCFCEHCALQVTDPGQFVDLLYCRRLRSASLREQVSSHVVYMYIVLDITRNVCR